MHLSQSCSTSSPSTKSIFTSLTLPSVYFLIIILTSPHDESSNLHFSYDKSITNLISSTVFNCFISSLTLWGLYQQDAINVTPCGERTLLTASAGVEVLALTISQVTLSFFSVIFTSDGPLKFIIFISFGFSGSSSLLNRKTSHEFIDWWSVVKI